MQPARLFVIAISVLALGSHASADVVYKVNGGKLRGKVNVAASAGYDVVIETPYGTFRVPKAQISRVEIEPENGAPAAANPEPAPAAANTDAPVTDPSGYAALAAQAKDTVDDQLKLAMWCLDNKLMDEYRKHLERVIALEPDHDDARTRLGYQKHTDGQWRTRDEIMELQGYVKYRGRWVLPQEKELAEAEEKAKETIKQYYKDIRTWQRGMRTSDPAKQAEAREALLAINDPLAVEALVKLMGEKGEEFERAMLAEILADIPGNEAEQTLLILALEDSAVAVRGVAVQTLGTRKTPAVLQQATAALKHSHNFVVQNAGVLLAQIGDSSVVPALIDALVTTHRYEKELNVLEQFQARQASSSFKATETTILPDGTMIRRSNVPNSMLQGGSRVSTGPNPDRIVRVDTVQNETVLRALAQITGVNHGFDKEAWFQWLADNTRTRGARIGP